MILSKKVVPLLVLFLASDPAPSQTLPLPPRPPGARTGKEIVQAITPLSRASREDTLFKEIMAGNIPDFLRVLLPVSSSGSVGGIMRSVTYYVTPDYLAVGSDEEYFLTPMTPLLAQRLADALHCTMPTRKMVNDIYFAAPLKLAPAPIPWSEEMITVPVFARHDSMVWAQRSPLLAPFPLGTLVGGTKKDVVISNKIRNDLKTTVPKPVVIYGWHQLNGVPIQPLYNGHAETYADYSHGIRLVQDSVMLDGEGATVTGILRDTYLSALLSDEGPIPFPRYGDAPSGVDQDSETLQGAMLLQIYPNPFNPSAVISYRIPAPGDVRLSVFDLLGREVRRLVDERRAPGTYEARFDGSGLAGGFYFCRLVAGDLARGMPGRMSQVRKMLLLR